MNRINSETGLRRIRNSFAKGAVLALAGTVFAAAHAEPLTWHLHNVTYHNGAVATGSFTYDANTNSFSNINVSVSGPLGTITLNDNNPGSPGNPSFMSFVGQASADMTGQPTNSFALASPMTDAGGHIDILPYPQGFSYAGTCSLANCGQVGGPYQDVTGGSLTTGRTWYLDNVTYHNGATAVGSFTYDAANNTFGNVDVTITGPLGTIVLNDNNPGSPGNPTFMSFVGQASADMTGQPTSSFALASTMTHAGGDIDIMPYPQGFSYAGTCSLPNCGQVGGPYQDITAGRLTTGRKWYLDGVTIAGGGAVYGSFNYNADTNAYSNVNVTVDNGSTVNTYTLQHSLPLNNAQTLFLVAADLPDMTGQNGLYLDFATALTNDGGAIALKPWPTGASSQGVCANDICTLFGNDVDEINAGNAMTGLPGPQITSAIGASVAENQTSAIDVQAVDIDDSEGNGLTFSLSGNVDDALFAIDADYGIVSFLSAPNVAAPTDADGDNTYEIKVTVSNTSGLSTDQTVWITVFGVPNITSLQTSLDFGAYAPNDVPVMTNVTISNTGNADLEVFGVTISGPSAGSFSVVNPLACVGTLTSAANCMTAIGFNPAADPTPGTKTATLTISSDDPDQAGLDISLTGVVSAVDTDGDGLTDDVDNCTFVANADQRDTDSDGFGNICDPDLNNDGIVNAIDLGMLKQVFFSTDPHADFNGDGVVNVMDIGIMKQYFFLPPGPAANTGT